MDIRRVIAVNTAKLIAFVCKKVGKQGVTLAGKAAFIIDPNILTKLSKEIKDKTFAVIGTNGKTTTNNLLCHVLEAQNKKVVCNHTGSNMLNGVISAFVLNADWRGHLDADYACIEVDEASLHHVFLYFKPDYCILTNLFRDQLDRYGEIDSTMNMVMTGFKMLPNMKVIVNADDVLSVYVAQESGKNSLAFGIKDKVTEESINEVREGGFCKKCGAKMKYHFYHFGQLGDYYCSSCDFKRPYIDYNASDIQIGSFKINGQWIQTKDKGLYNVYNILAVYAALKEMELSTDIIVEVLKEYNPGNGRNEKFYIKNTEVTLNLAKNPAGFNQNIAAVRKDEREKDIIIMINDNDQDGRDVSWLWDVEFDRLQEANINSITVSGIRCQDMRLRLKYIDIPSILEKNIEKAIKERIASECSNLYVLVNYTGLYSTHRFLKKMEEESKKNRNTGGTK